MVNHTSGTGPDLLTAAVVSTLVALASLAFRNFVRFKLVKCTDGADYAVNAAMVFALAGMVTSIFAARIGLEPESTRDTDADANADRQSYMLLATALTQIFWVLAVTAGKLAACLACLSLVEGLPLYSWGVRCLAGFTVVINGTTLIVQLAACPPSHGLRDNQVYRRVPQFIRPPFLANNLGITALNISALCPLASRTCRRLAEARILHMDEFEDVLFLESLSNMKGRTKGPAGVHHAQVTAAKGTHDSQTCRGGGTGRSWWPRRDRTHDDTSSQRGLVDCPSRAMAGDFGSAGESLRILKTVSVSVRVKNDVVTGSEMGDEAERGGQ